MGLKRNILNVSLVVLFTSVVVMMMIRQFFIASIIAIFTFLLSYYRKYFYDFLSVILKK